MINYLKKFYVIFFQLFPVRYRFAVLTLISKLFAAILRYAFFMKKYRAAIFKFDPDVSPALLWCLRPLMEIDLGLEVVVDDSLLRNAVDLKQGAVLIGYHGTFMPLFIPMLYDHGYSVNSWSIRDKEVYFGRDITHSLKPSPTAFFTAKNILTEGGLITVLIDFEAKHVKRAQEIDTQFGKMFITDSFFRLASTCQSNLVFIKYVLNGKRIVFELGKPVGIGLEVNEITKQYTNFLQNPVTVSVDSSLNNDFEIGYPKLA